MPKSGDTLAHLAPDAREFATLPDEQRIQVMKRDRWATTLGPPRSWNA